MTADLASARLEWERAYREFQDVTRDSAQSDRIRRQLDAVSDELRRRVGGTFTLRELADEYVVADHWARAVLEDNAIAGWSRTLAVVEGAAFHLYARGAVDYTP